MVRAMNCFVMDIGSLSIKGAHGTNVLIMTVWKGTVWSMLIVPVMTDQSMWMWDDFWYCSLTFIPLSEASSQSLEA